MNGPPIHNYNRRWYDRISNMTLALLVSQKFPPEIQAIIVRNLNQVIDDCRKRQKRNDKHAVSVGQQRVMGLYKAGRRLRWYDPDPNMHRAFNFMSTVPESYLEDFAGRILKVGKYMEQQKDALRGSRDQSWLEDTVEGILRQTIVSVTESDEGFRLVDNAGGSGPVHPRHIIPTRPPKQQP
jgi:hypothetical protein